MAYVVAKNVLQKQAIAKAKYELSMLEADGTNAASIKAKARYVAQLEAKIERNEACTDMVTVTKELKDGTLRVRQCAKCDVAAFVAQGYASEAKPAKAKPAKD